MRSPPSQLDSRPYYPQLEKACMQQQTPSTAKKKLKKKKKKVSTLPLITHLPNKLQVD